MLTSREIQTLASRPKRDRNTVLTIYLNLSPSSTEGTNRPFETHLKNLLAKCSTAADAAERNAFREASQRAGNFVRTLEVRSPGLVMVMDAFDNFFWTAETAFPVQNQIRWDNEAHILPLVLGFERHEPTGIVLLDRANIRLFTMFAGSLKEVASEHFDHKAVRHTKTVGMNNISSASQAQRRADEHVRLNLRGIIRHMDSLVKQHQSARLILAGSHELTEELRSLLPRRLASLVIGVVETGTAAALDQLRQSATAVLNRYEQQRSSTGVSHLVEICSQSGPATLGLGRTLNALNQGRVWQLISTEGFRSPGYECATCLGLFTLEASECPACGGSLRAVDDVVDRALGRAIRKGMRIEVVRNGNAAATLADAGGIGALLRTRTATAQAS